MTQPALEATTEYSLDGNGDAGLEDFLRGEEGEIQDDSGAPETDDSQSTPEETTEDTRYQELEAEATRIREENQRLQREASLKDRYSTIAGQIRQDHQQRLQTSVSRLMAQGFSEQDARQWAEPAVNARTEALAYQYQNKLSTERLVALEEGVPQEILADYWDEPTMRQRAQNYKATGGADRSELEKLRKEFNDFKAQAAKERASRVPPQPYNQPNGNNRPNSDSAIISRYANGEIPWSPRVQQALDRV